MSKQEATRLADALENLKRNSFGQVQDMPVYEAAALLRRWPDGEPVGHLHSSGDFCQDRALDGGVMWPVPLYTAPPDSAARIAELEKERDDFHMQYRVKCDEETKAQAVRIAALEVRRD